MSKFGGFADKAMIAVGAAISLGLVYILVGPSLITIPPGLERPTGPAVPADAAASSDTPGVVSVDLGGGVRPIVVKDWTTLRIALERGACFGACPVYKLEIAGDGRVRYTGDRFVPETGAREARLAPEKVRALVGEFARANYLALKDQYRAQVTDLPSYTITLAFDGMTKTVVDYGGAMVGMPRSICRLQNAIDVAAGSQAWTGVDASKIDC